MAEGAIAVDGLKELNAALGKVSKDLPNELKDIHKDLARPVANRAASMAPVGPSGRLAKSVRPSGTRRVASVLAGKKAVPYAGAIHWGWPRRGIRANDFLTRAMHAEQSRTVDRYAEAMDDFLNRLIGD